MGAKVTGVEAALEILDKKIKALSKVRRVVVGFNTDYAIYVHENLEANHPIGQAKFLEQPARENANIYGQVVVDTVKAGGTLENGLLLAGLTLQRDAQELCPVDTGVLKNSAYTIAEDVE